MCGLICLFISSTCEMKRIIKGSLQDEGFSKCFMSLQIFVSFSFIFRRLVVAEKPIKIFFKFKVQMIFLSTWGKFLCIICRSCKSRCFKMKYFPFGLDDKYEGGIYNFCWYYTSWRRSIFPSQRYLSLARKAVTTRDEKKVGNEINWSHSSGTEEKQSLRKFRRTVNFVFSCRFNVNSKHRKVFCFVFSFSFFDSDVNTIKKFCKVINERKVLNSIVNMSMV